MRNWKSGRDAALCLNSENGRLSVTYKVDLGVWVDPTPKVQPSPTSDGRRGHQGPRRGAGPPSRQRRRERRAAERAPAAAAATDSTENVEDIVAEAIENPALKKSRTCTKCGGLVKGHPGPYGRNCKVILQIPEKERHSSSTYELYKVN